MPQERNVHASSVPEVSCFMAASMTPGNSPSSAPVLSSTREAVRMCTTPLLDNEYRAGMTKLSMNPLVYQDLADAPSEVAASVASAVDGHEREHAVVGLDLRVRKPAAWLAGDQRLGQAFAQEVAVVDVAAADAQSSR